MLKAIVLTALVLSRPAVAFAFDIGVEGGAVMTFAHGSSPLGQASFGLVLEHVFEIEPSLRLTPWIDAQIPLDLSIPLFGSASYWPIDAGLRVGIPLGALVPYAGFVGQLLILHACDCDIEPAQTIWALGMDLGIDWSILFLRAGFEARYLTTVSHLTQPGSFGYSSEIPVGELMALLTARIVL
jgi:hypothetical protein